MTMEEVDELALDPFVEKIGWGFEHSPWVAERAWPHRPFLTVDRLHAAMVEAVRNASREEQLNLIRAHPDLGARARMSAASTGEQARAGLDSLTAEEFEKITRLNGAYREKFGFPFLYAVKGSGKSEILAALESRLGREPETEHATALEQIYRIARFRLEDTISCANS